MKPLILDVTGDNLAAKNEVSYISGSKGYYTAEFTFDNDWDGLTPHIVVVENGTERPHEIIVDNTHKIATTESGLMQIGVYGLDSEGKKCISSNYVCIEVNPGAYTGITPIPKDIWDGYQIKVLGYVERAEGAASNAKDNADKAEKAAESIKNISATANEGEEVAVTQSVSENGGIVLDFMLPRGKKGDKGDKGDKGHTPVKGVDYFTDADKEEMLSEPREIYSFSNGTRLEAREDGVYVITENENGAFEQVIVDSDGNIIANHADYAEEAYYASYAGYAESAGYALEAENDVYDRPLKGIAVDDYAGDVEDAEFYLSDGYAIYYGIVSNSLIATFGEDAVAGFSCALYFTTPDTIPENYTQFPDTIFFKGDSTDEGAFTPEANMRYTMVFDYDGYMTNAYVSGVTTV